MTIPMAVLSSQAQAGENWVKFGTDSAGHNFSIDMNSFRKGIDGLDYFSDSIDDGDTYFSDAVDCRRQVFYVLGGSDGELTDWRHKGINVAPHSIAAAELKIVCAKLGSGPLAGNWVSIGTTGESIDKDSIRRGSDGLVYFTDYDDAFHVTGSNAADCQRRLIYFGVKFNGWRDRGLPVPRNSFAEAEFNLVCANAK